MRILWLAPILFMVSCGALASGTPEATDELSVRETAQRLISNDIAETIGQGALSPVCEEVAEPYHGREFLCSATAGEKNIYLTGRIEDDGRISLKTSNVLLASDLPQIEAAAISYTNASLGTTYGTEAFSCGSGSIVLNPERVFACTFVDPATGQAYGAQVQLESMEEKTVRVTIDSQPQG